MATPIPQNRAHLSPSMAVLATGGTLVRTSAGSAISVGITSDSRAITPGCAFVALRGETHDGHQYLGQAIAAGASMVIVEEGRALPEVDANVIAVPDTLDAWGALARAHLRGWRAETKGRVVAITGSAGKTTTKELCATLLTATSGRPCHKTSGNLNNRIGLPSVVGLEREHAYAVLEMGMSVPGEIAKLARIAEPDVGVITNVGLAHAEGLGGQAAIAEEKGALFCALEPRATAVANADDVMCMEQASRTRGARVETFGRAPSARYRLLDRTPRGEHGSEVVIARPAGGDVRMDLPLLGEAAALDLVAAFAACEAALGGPLDAEKARSALSSLPELGGRSTVRILWDGTIVLDDSYNANPASMRAALATLKEISKDRRPVAVLGEMKELGSVAREEHERLGAEIVRAGVRVVIGCGGLVELALDPAERAGVLVFRASGSDEAAVLACEHVRKGDAVLVKGSRSVATEKVVQALLARARRTSGEKD